MANWVMGLDLSLRSTGIVFMSTTSGRFLQYGVGSKCASDDRTGQFMRLVEITDGIIMHMREHMPTAIGIEGAAYGAIGQQFSLGELAGFVKHGIWEEYELMPHVVSVTAARKFFIGKGGGSIKKDALWKLVNAKGIEFMNKDCMDGWMIANYVKGKILGLKSMHVFDTFPGMG